MATKTSSKTATRKPAVHTAARKTTGRQPIAASKPKVLKKEERRDVADAAAPAKSHAPDAKAERRAGAAPIHEHESVSLIDKKKPRQKAEDGEVKPKRDVLPTISR